jgi:serine/threonine-protein kinase
MARPERRIGRYAIYGEFAAGGMARVNLGRFSGPRGFAKIVAVKSLHAEVARDPDAAAAFMDEARLMSRIRHPNVVDVLDVLNARGELYLVMEYVAGVSLATLIRECRQRGTRIPPAVAAAMVIAVLDGLHAAHEAKDESGQPLHIVHRDVSPQNVLVGADGVARVLDFGIAKAVSRSAATRGNVQKGKPGYMSPEQIRGEAVDARADVWAAAVILWELLTGSRLFAGDNDWAVSRKVLERSIDAPSRLVASLPREVDLVVERGLARDAAARFASAREMAQALERAVPPASPSEVGRLVDDMAKEELARMAAALVQIERTPVTTHGARALVPSAIVALVVVGVALIVWQRVSVREPVAPELPPQASVPLMAEAVAPRQSEPNPSAAPVPSTARPASPRPPAPRTKPSASVAGPPDEPDCDPPYVVDSEGFHKMKPECLQR